jgi:putative addiction module component (TIGR02574 family)
MFIVTDAAKRLSLAARNLSPADRLELVERLLDSLDAPDETIDRLWLAEAEDRLAAYRRGEIEAVPLATVLAKYASS